MNQQTMKTPRFWPSKMPWKGVLAVCFLFFFLLGILTANWVGQEKLVQYGMLNQYYISQMAYMDLDSSVYFWYLLKQRMHVFVLLAFGVYTRFGAFVFVGVVGWYAFSLGYLFVNALVCMGFAGMLLVLVSIFPQIFGYIAAGAGFVKILFGQSAERSMPIGRQRIWRDPKLFLVLAAFLCVVAGVWLESYVNPVLLKAYIRRM